MPIPIPNRRSGFTLGAHKADVAIDVFMDIQCPHSKQAWSVLLDVVAHYQDQPVSVTVHLITLSNHRQAWDISLGLFALAADDAHVFFDFASYLFERQDEFYNQRFTHKTHQDLISLVADYAVDHAGVERDTFIQRMREHDVYINARTPIRYAATRAVWATPTLFINNADDVAVNHRSSLVDWRHVIDPLL